MSHQVYHWLGFGAFVLTMMVLDLGVFHRKAHAVSMREAAIWTVVWLAVALAFNGFIYWDRGSVSAVEFLTGYIIEWSLSMDNVFVFAVIFSYFAVPAQYQHRVLFWGILGAVVMRLVFIVAGAALLERFHWIIYPMGGFLVLTGIKLFFERNKKQDMSKNWVLRLAGRWLPVTDDYVGHKFFVRRRYVKTEAVTVASSSAATGDLVVHQDGAKKGTGPICRDGPPGASHKLDLSPFSPRRWFSGWFATPLFLVLLVVETTDVAFAVDSIPAIFAVTRDPFIVFTSNVFAILGLRALYFLLAGAMGMFRYLGAGLAAILCFVGTKMLISGLYHIPISVSLGVVCGILVVAVGVSLAVAKMESGRVIAQQANGRETVEVDEHVEVKV